ncbi:methyl-accepting chemotaxis protein [Cytobacillus sp. Hz8]|uniref:methyl-accepting chemotaxis protein n=1 Tax=Cytobacillus sp. Hz8 TaxID=3347168 RepID=UPI0035DAB01D
MKNRLQSRNAYAAKSKVERVAQKIEQQIKRHGSVDKCMEEIRVIMDEELGQDEYFVFVNREGRGLIHTNRLREGTLFQDEVGLKSANTKEPLLQMYARNTGEILIDASCLVIQMPDGRQYNLRMGRIVHRPFLVPFIFGLGILPSLFTVFLGRILGGEGQLIFWIPLLSLVIGIGGATVFYNQIRRRLNEWYQVTRSISAGHLNIMAPSKGRNQFAQMGYELNKIIIGTRDIVQELAKSALVTQEVSEHQAYESRQLSQTFTEMSAMMQKFREGTEEQLASLEEFYTMIGQMMTEVNQMQKNTDEARRLSKMVADASKRGQKAIDDSEEEMNRIEMTVDDSVQTIIQVSDGVNHIMHKVSAITNIARQTNMLALNASIEASRAGAGGKGFAIVASEVRKLAESTSAFASEILEALQQIQYQALDAGKKASTSMNAIKRGKDVGKVAGQAIDEMKEAADQAQQQVISNYHLAEQLTTDFSEIEKIIGNLTTISEQFTDSMSKAAATMEEKVGGIHQLAENAKLLLDQSQSLNKIVKRFKLS